MFLKPSLITPIVVSVVVSACGGTHGSDTSAPQSVDTAAPEEQAETPEGNYGGGGGSGGGADCNGRDFSLWTQIVSAGSAAYTIDHRVVRYKNCSNHSVRMQPDISYRPNPGCRTVAPGETTQWDFSVEHAF